METGITGSGEPILLLDCSIATRKDFTRRVINWDRIEDLDFRALGSANSFLNRFNEFLQGSVIIPSVNGELNRLYEIIFERFEEFRYEFRGISGKRQKKVKKAMRAFERLCKTAGIMRDRVDAHTREFPDNDMYKYLEGLVCFLGKKFDLKNKADQREKYPDKHIPDPWGSRSDEQLVAYGVYSSLADRRGARIYTRDRDVRNLLAVTSSFFEEARRDLASRLVKNPVEVLMLDSQKFVPFFSTKNGRYYNGFVRGIKLRVIKTMRCYAPEDSERADLERQKELSFAHCLVC